MSNGKRQYRLNLCAALLSLVVASLLVQGTKPAVAQQISGAVDLVAPGGTVGEGPTASGPRGTATFRQLDGANTQAIVVLLGMEPGGTYSWHIHDGACSGPVLYAPSQLQAGADGMAKGTDQLPLKIDLSRWYVDVHMVGGGSSSKVLCGKVNPAIFQPAPLPGTGISPGMPQTGAGLQSQQPWPLLTLGAADLLVIFGVYLHLGARAASRL